MTMTNQEVARLLNEMAILLDMERIQFKPRAYEKAAMEVENYAQNLDQLYKDGGIKALMGIPSVGKSIAEHIEEILKGGTFKEYEKLKKKTPVNISELAGVGGVGPQMIKVLWEKLKVRNLEDLEKACRAGKIRELPNFGEKSEQKILKGIEFLKTAGGRRLLGEILPEVRALEKMIQSFSEVKQVAMAGSIRRRKETIGDIDILVTSLKPEKVMDRFTELPWIAHIYGKGPTKTNVRLKNGLNSDLRVVPEESFGAALCYFTGSKSHNIALREIAVKKGWKLNEYGLFENDKMIGGKTENELYKALGLQYVEPELREDTGEIEAARLRKLPELIGYQDLKGDLQVQTDWTDGENSIEEMAVEAARMGLEYIAITDHTKSLAMTRGSDENRLLDQIVAIKEINENLKRKGLKLKILCGAEVNIMKDGSLDIADKVLAKLDVVGAAVHHFFDLPKNEQTKRVLRAMHNPNVDIIFHLTSRLIHRRGAIELDIDQVIHSAKETGTILEIDSFPDRLDLRDEYIRKCHEAGVRMSIDSDSHSVGHFRYLEFGIAQARRGWATNHDIVNTRPVQEFLSLLKQP
jgi:DNA polymerase (family X)